MIDNNKILELPITKTQFLPAFLLKQFEVDDATDKHVIAYAQGRIIDYSTYAVYDEWLEEGATVDSYKDDPKDTLYLRDKEKGISHYAHIEILADIADFTEFEKQIN